MVNKTNVAVAVNLYQENKKFYTYDGNVRMSLAFENDSAMPVVILPDDSHTHIALNTTRIIWWRTFTGLMSFKLHFVLSSVVWDYLDAFDLMQLEDHEIQTRYLPVMPHNKGKPADIEEQEMRMLHPAPLIQVKKAKVVMKNR